MPATPNTSVGKSSLRKLSKSATLVSLLALCLIPPAGRGCMTCSNPVTSSLPPTPLSQWRWPLQKANVMWDYNSFLEWYNTVKTNISK